MSRNFATMLWRAGGHMLAWLRGRVVAIIAFAALVVLYALPYLLAPLGTYASPDEAATAFFVREVAERWRLAVPWPISDGVNALVHPRSMRVLAGQLVPGSFATMAALYGAIAGVVGEWVTVWLTPVLAALGVWWWGGIVAKLGGNRRLGLVAGTLVALHPAWWYWASRGLMGNVPTVALLLGAGWWWLRGTRWAAACSGAFVALALAIRPGELHWVALALVVLLVGYRRQLPWLRLAWMAGGAALAAVPCVVVHVAVFGWGFGGYGATLGEVGVQLTQGWGNRLLGPLQPWVFPLGFAPRTAMQNFLTYGLGFFWWWTALVAAAVAWLAWRRQFSSREVQVWLLAALLAGGWMIALYGSFLIGDNSAGDVTIGSSYFRYWLPLFVLSTAVVAVAGERLWSASRGHLRWGIGGLGAVVAVAAVATTLWAPAEGLVASQAALRQSAAARAFVAAHTPANAIVVVDRADKFVFPERRVLQPLRSAYTYAAICQLYPRYPLYYYGITLPPADLAFVRDVQLRACDLQLQPEAQHGEETLYRVVRTTSAPVAQRMP